MISTTHLFESLEFTYSLLSAIPVPVCLINTKNEVINLNTPKDTPKLTSYLEKKYNDKSWVLDKAEDQLLYDTVIDCREKNTRISNKGKLPVNKYGNIGGTIISIHAVPIEMDNQQYIILTIEDHTELEILKGILSVCMKCNKVEDKKSKSWVKIDEYIAAKTQADLSHGLCPSCASEMFSLIEEPS